MNCAKTPSRSSLVSQVAELLCAQIRGGHWGIGERIPTEPELCELTKTGRNTIREAVQGLVQVGLLERRQGSGTYVVAGSAIDASLNKYFTTADEHDAFELRQALLVTAAPLAARRRTPIDIVRLKRLQKEISSLFDGSDTELAAADSTLHRAIIQASHNAIYLDLYEALSYANRASVEFRSRTVQAGACDERKALVTAVIAGDDAVAQRAAHALFMEQH
ncbi:FadR/GntR family transcriptional regulator [Rhodococcus pyridinivorans]